MDRRDFIRNSGLVLGATAVLPALGSSKPSSTLNGWADVRSQFQLTSKKIHMTQMLLAGHPAPVREAIERHRKNFDENPTEYWETNYPIAEPKVQQAAGRYLQVDPTEIALTDSTTMGLGTLYTGLRLKEGDEILTGVHDHYATEKSLEYAALKNKATVRRVPLYSDPSKVTADEIVGNMVKAIKPNTRVVAQTWVHSCTGVKIPVAKMAAEIKRINQGRTEADRIYFCVDGVHGFGIDNITMGDLGCDFFVAGTHKWIFGPRGTGIIYGRKDAWDMFVPTIPSFSMNSYGQWLGLVPEGKLPFGDHCSPGGFHSFEHRWALADAFDFVMKIGKEKIEARTRQLSTMVKEGLREMKHVRVQTPMSTELSAGINCFEVIGWKPDDVVKKLLEKNIICSSSPYRTSYVRFTPCIVNTEEEVATCLKAIAELKS